jgi:hypothetical protein
VAPIVSQVPHGERAADEQADGGGTSHGTAPSGQAAGRSRWRPCSMH